MSASSVTVSMFYILYCEAQKYSYPYKQIEEGLRHACPDFDSPNKWSNITRFVLNNVKRSKNMTKPVFSMSNNTRKSFGPLCDKYGIYLDVINANEVTNLPFTVGAFKEICLFKKKEGKSWRDVSLWISKILPNKLNASESKLSYFFNKIMKLTTSLSKQGLKSELESLLGTDFVTFTNRNRGPCNGKKTTKACCQNKEIKLILKNIQLQKNVITVENENEILKDVVRTETSLNQQSAKKLMKLQEKSEKNKKLKQELVENKQQLKARKFL